MNYNYIKKYNIDQVIFWKFYNYLDDYNRVKLMKEPNNNQSDYINASYIEV